MKILQINGWRKLKENTMSEWRVSHQILPPPESWKTRKVLIPYNENKRNQWRKKEDITRAFPITVAWFVDEMGQTEFFIYTVCFSVNYPELHCCEHYDI